MSTTTEQADLTQIITRVAGLDPSTPFDQVVNTLGLIAEMKRCLKDIEDEAKAVAVEQLRRDGPKHIGEVKYWAGATKVTKCRELLPAIESLIAACGGDWSEFVNCLASDALKHGAAKKLFEKAGAPEKFEAHFEVTEKWAVKDNGEKVPLLQSINPAFVR